MNKQSLVEFVRVSILKSEAVADNQKTLHFQRVAQAVNYAFDTLLSQIKLDDKGKAAIEAYYVKHYYNQPVSESNGYRYFGISDSIVPVGEGKGVWYVQPSGGGKPFSRASRPKIATYRNLKVGSAIRETVWRLGNLNTKKQIILENIGDSPMADARFVDYGIVRGFDAYDDTEEVVPPDGRVDLIVQLATAWLSPVYNDMTNNGK